MKKIMLVCSGLEPGRDGVGDYCRRLAAELTRLGISCSILALNDGHATSDILASPESPVRLTRLPSALSHAAKLARARAAIADFDPDWISLQFVSYGFNSKGIPFREIFYLPSLFGDRHLHVMMHELWVGLGVEASLKNALIGALQKRVVVALLWRLRPRVLTTTVHFLQRFLAREGFSAEVLPLFGNIPPSSSADDDRVIAALRQHGAAGIDAGREAFWVFAMFGVVYDVWPAEDVFAQLALYARRAGRRIAVVFAGNAGAGAQSIAARLRKVFPEIAFAFIGHQSSEVISEFLNSADFGITSHPLYAVGKSGSVNAMLEHGLPVIVSWGNIAPDLPAIDPEVAPLLWHADAQLESKLLAPPPRTQFPFRAANCAREMLACLEDAGDRAAA